jgi:hypothetical protein
MKEAGEEEEKNEARLVMPVLLLRTAVSSA